MNASRSSRVGILGGTFNPIHLGHLRGAEEAVELLLLDLCLFIPAWVPPHKPSSGIVSFADRWQMLQLAMAGHPCFRASDVEARLKGTSYTVKTLQELRGQMPPETLLYLILGSDAFAEIQTWWHYRELFELASLAILERPGSSSVEVGAFLKSAISQNFQWDPIQEGFHHPALLPVYYLRSTHLEISSSGIRERIRQGKSVRYLVPNEVMDYINKHNFYRSAEDQEPTSSTLEEHD